MGVKYMKIGEIISDAIMYPLTDWRTFLLLGLIIVFSSLYSFTGKLASYGFIIILLIILAFVLTLVKMGYQLRVMESTTQGNNILPGINRWKGLMVDGLRVLIVGIVYALPLIVIIVPLIIITAITSIGSGTSPAASSMLRSLGIVLVISGLYLLIIYPIFFMSLANMANNERDIGAAFKFSEIKNIISNIGIGKLIVWYIVTGLIYVIILIIHSALPVIFNIIHIKVLGSIIAALLISPFALLFLYRSVALIYLDGVNDAEMDET